MKTYLVILASLMLVLGSVSVVWALSEQSTTASVSVNELIDITVTGTIDFGSVDAGSSDNPDADQGVGAPAVTVTNEATSTVNIDVSLKGTDWSGPGAFTLADSNTRYDDDYQLNDDYGSLTITQLTTSYAEYHQNIARSSSAEVWYWMNVPTGKEAGAYTSTFSFQGTKAT